MAGLLTILLSFLLLIGSAGAAAIGFDEARHLLVRTGFEASPAAIERLKPLSHEQAVAVILKESRTEAITPPPAWSSETQIRPNLRPDATQRALWSRLRRERYRELKGWWFREMRATPAPLTERMTLLWHAHFPCALDNVEAPQLMQRQNALLRRESLGSLRTLLLALVKDPAMLQCQGVDGSRKGHVDETFARMLLERTVGRGHYTAHDVQEAARAFTGWRVTETGTALFDEVLHDGGAKAVLSRRGRLGSDDVVDAVLRDPFTAETIVRRLWREFIDDKPDPGEVRRLAQEFRKNYELKPLLRQLLFTRAFRSPSRRGQMIKSPVELLVGTARQFSIGVGDGQEFSEASRGLGQDLFQPPQGGWSSGTGWITTETLVTRQRLLSRLMRGLEEDAEGAVAVSEVDEVTPRELTAILLPMPPVDPVPAALSSFDLAAHLVRDPAYQLK